MRKAQSVNLAIAYMLTTIAPNTATCYYNYKYWNN